MPGMSQDTPQDEPVTAPAQGRGCRRVLTIGGAVLLLALGVFFYRIYTFLSPVPVEIGPETTVIEEPLLPDGRVDYVGALNERMSEGVTPENNAVVLLLEAFGPEIIKPEHRREFFQLLGIPQHPREGDYLVRDDEWIRSLNPTVDYDLKYALEQKFAAALDRPWSREEFPEVAGWLDVNQEPLKRIAEASRRPRYYCPLVSGAGEPALISAQLISVLNAVRQCGRLLGTRALLRIHEGDLEGAWGDLLTCHRISRLIGEGVADEGATNVSNMVAVAVSNIACNASESFAHADSLSAEQARAALDDMDSVLPLPDFAQTIDVVSRFEFLDSIQTAARGEPVEGLSPELQSVSGRRLDWSLVMQFTNKRFDEAAEGLRSDTFKTQQEHLASLNAEVQATVSQTTSQTLIATALMGSHSRSSELAADLFFALTSPALEYFCIAECQANARFRLVRIALMLAAYRTDHDNYPDALDDLTPDDFGNIPLDPFTDAPFRYKRTASGYRLYSVGGNMTDDGGRSLYSDPRGDDILVAAPAAESVPAREPSEQP